MKTRHDKNRIWNYMATLLIWEGYSGQGVGHGILMKVQGDFGEVIPLVAWKRLASNKSIGTRLDSLIVLYCLIS